MKWKKIFVVVAMITMFVGLTAQSPEIIARWDFGTNSNSPVYEPQDGEGTLTRIGGVSQGTGSGVADLANGITEAGARLGTATYPAESVINTGAGIEVLVNTTGYENITLTWHGHSNNNGANRSRIQYTVNGVDWIEFVATGGVGGNATNIVTQSSADAGFATDTINGVQAGLYKTTVANFHTRSADFSSISGINNNEDFGVRFLTAFDETQTPRKYVATSGTYAPTGTIGFDNITFKGTPIASAVAAPTFTPPNGPIRSTDTIAIECETVGASIYYTTNGATPTASSTPYSTPIAPPASTTNFTLKAIAILATDESTVTEAEYTVTEVTNIGSIHALKALLPDADAIYTITGGVVITQVLHHRDRMFVQDVPVSESPVAGIVIDIDPSSSVTVAGDVGDVITGLTGKWKTVDGMQMFEPIDDAIGVSGGTVTVKELTLAELTANTADYSAMLVKVADVYFTQTGNFAPTTAYTLTNGTLSFTFRATFSTEEDDYPDYIATPIPTTLQNITGHIFTNTNGTFLSARAIADFEESNTVIAVAPTNVLVKALGRNVVITWDLTTPTPPTGFNVQRKLGDNGVYANVNSQLIPVADRAYTDLNVPWNEPNGEYVYNVVAVYTSEDKETESAPLTHLLGTKDLFISEYIEGVGTTKAIELFNPTSGTIDLTEYALKLNSNGGATWGQSLDLTGTLVSEGILVVYNNASSNNYLASRISEIEAAHIAGQLQHVRLLINTNVINFNGNDPVGLFRKGSTASEDILIDTFGAFNEGTGASNSPDIAVAGISGAAVDHTIIRKPAIYKGNSVWATSTGTNEDNSEWDVAFVSNATNGNAQDLGLHSYTDPDPAQPYVATPVITPASGYYAIAQEVTITCADPNDAEIRYTVDGTEPTASSTLYSTAITVDHSMTIKARGYAAAHTPSGTATATYNILEAVDSIHALRSKAPGTPQVYKIAGDVIVTHTLNNRNQKFIQDLPDAQAVDPDIAGIIIDDAPGVIVAELAVGDVIAGGDLIGTLTTYQGMLQFVPMEAVTSSETATEEPVVVTLDLLEADPAPYQSMLVKVNDVIFDEAGATFVRATEYHIGNEDGDFLFRAIALGDEPDYIGTAVPTRLTDLTGIIYTSNATTFLSARNVTDIDEHTSEEPMAPYGVHHDIAGMDITLHWSIADQTILQGFWVHRSTTADGTYTKLSDETIIPAAQRTYIDLNVDYGTYYYKIEAVYAGESLFTAPYEVEHEEFILVPLFISEYVDGATNSRAIEIFNPSDEAVDLTGYALKVSTDGGNFGAALALTGNIAAYGRHIVYNSGGAFGHANNAAFLTAMGELTGVSLQAGNSHTTFNGNDAIGLFYEEDPIDVFGIAENGTAPANFDVAGVATAAYRHTIVRKPDVAEGNIDWAESAGTTSGNSEWVVYPYNTFTLLGHHDFMIPGEDYVATPTFSVMAGAYPQAQSVTIACTTEGATIRYTIDGTEPIVTSDEYTQAIAIVATTTLKARAFKTDLMPSFVASATYTILTLTPTPVASLHELRTQTVDTTVYKIEGDVIVTKVLANRNQKFIQDISVSGSPVAGMLIDIDYTNSAVMDTPYSVGDVIPGGTLYGRLSLFGGVLQFAPIVIAPASLHNQTITPVTVTLGTLTGAYQAMLVKVEGASFSAPGTFAAETVLTLADVTGTFPFRARIVGSLDDPDYVGTAIPTGRVDITGIVYSLSADSHFLSARNSADIVAATEAPVTPSGVQAHSEGNNVVISWITPTQTILQGFNVHRSTAIDGTYTVISGNSLLGPAIREYTDVALAFGTYYYKIEASYLVEALTVTLTTDPITVNHAEVVSLFISEYVEGAGYAKAIEIFNPSANTVDLSGYSLKLNSNGGTSLVTHNFTGTLPSLGMVIVYQDTSTGANLILDMLDDLEALDNVTLVVNNNVANFNGNDPVGLYYGDTLIDTFGAIGSGTGTSNSPNIDVAGEVGAALDHTIVRKSTVTQGNIDWAESAGTDEDDSEWIVYARDYFSTNNTLGHHTFGGEVEPDLLPPHHLTATLSAPPVVELSWQAPNQVNFTHATTNEDQFYIGADDASLFGEYKLMHRFTVAQLAEMGAAGKTLTEVAFITNSTAISYSVYVYTGGSFSGGVYDPGTLATSQAVPASAIETYDWTYVTLTNPVTIPASGELWIGYGGVVNTTGFIAGGDDNTATTLNGLGNVLYFAGTNVQFTGWTTLSNLQTAFNITPVIHCSWMIKGKAFDTEATAPAGYNVYRKLASETAFSATPLATVTATTHNDSHTATGIYDYVVKAVYAGDQLSEASNMATVDVDILSGNEVTTAAKATALHANYPNPFNPSTTISFSVAVDGNVAIDVYNIKGQHVKTLVNRVFASGVHSVVWNGLDESGRGVGNGVYFYRMTADGVTQTRKMLLMK